MWMDLLQLHQFREDSIIETIHQITRKEFYSYCIRDSLAYVMTMLLAEQPNYCGTIT
jgi:hypothetical protein